MSERLVARLLVREHGHPPADARTRYDEASSLTLDAAGQPLVSSGQAGRLATSRTMDIDTKTISDRGPTD